ncbi:unnamed protein product [Linum trigynum]|uniref:Uncharacterized protein n=1 Tax=Linum trigynum TaxID=586398 RepID=A0AAV2GRE3_9ROSI
MNNDSPSIPSRAEKRILGFYSFHGPSCTSKRRTGSSAGPFNLVGTFNFHQCLSCCRRSCACVDWSRLSKLHRGPVELEVIIDDHKTGTQGCSVKGNMEGTRTRNKEAMHGKRLKAMVSR